MICFFWCDNICMQGLFWCFLVNLQMNTCFICKSMIIVSAAFILTVCVEMLSLFPFGCTECFSVCVFLSILAIECTFCDGTSPFFGIEPTEYGSVCVYLSIPTTELTFCDGMSGSLSLEYFGCYLVCVCLFLKDFLVDSVH